MPVNQIDGLTEQEVQARVALGQVNASIDRSSRSLADILRANVLTRFNAILGALFAVMLIIGPWRDAMFGGILIFNTLIGIVQELRAKTHSIVLWC